MNIDWDRWGNISIAWDWHHWSSLLQDRRRNTIIAWVVIKVIAGATTSLPGIAIIIGVIAAIAGIAGLKQHHHHCLEPPLPP